MKDFVLPIAAALGLFISGCGTPKITVLPPDDADVAVRQELSFPENVWKPDDGGQNTVAPILIRVKRPEYPSILHGTGVTGYAIIEYVIDEKGDTTHVQVGKASNRYFARSARSAVEAWKYTPAYADGKPVVLRAQQKFQFAEK